jgi:multisubunit Na+/H+ antiporter MnhB subunit
MMWLFSVLQIAFTAAAIWTLTHRDIRRAFLPWHGLSVQPRPNPWPHRLFWLVAGLVVLPSLAILAGLVGARSPGAAMVLMLAGGAALVLGYRATRPKPAAATPPAAWSPWPRRVFLALLLVVLLPLALLFIGLLAPALAKRADQPDQAAQASPTAATDIGELPEQLPPGEPVAAALKWHHAWKRLREAEAKASVGAVAPAGPEVLAAQRDLAVAESEFRQQPEIAARARLAYAEAMLDITQRKAAVGRATEAELDAARRAVTEARELLRGSPP